MQPPASSRANTESSFGFILVVALASILGGTFAANADTFTLDPFSPTLPLIPAAGPGDLLFDVGGPPLPGAPPPPLIGTPLPALGLIPGDVVDAISDGMDPVAGMHADYFSVTRGSVGVPGTGVDMESTILDTPPGATPGHAGDVFLSGGGLPLGANLLAPSGFGWTMGTATGDEFNTGLFAPTFPPAAGDEVNAYDLALMPPGTAVLFSLAPGSPSLGLLFAGPADILGVGGVFGPVPVIVLPAGPGLGLPAGADIDALAVAFFIPPGPVPGAIEYSLTAATAPLVPAALGSGATILGLAPGPVPITAHAPPALGLLPTDDLDALDVDIPSIPSCWDGIDNDSDALIDTFDPDCTSPLDPLEGPDRDGDNISNALDADDDGDGVLTLGSAECTLLGWAGTTAAGCCTGPGLGACATDNCAWTANPAQTDIGGVGAAPSDGIGDACQCGDTNDSGTVTATDATVLRRAIAGLGPYFSVASGLGGGGPGLDKCNVGSTPSPGVAGCTASDATVISRALASLPPGIAQSCDAAQP